MARRNLKEIDKTILQNFDKLVLTQEKVRLTAAASTYKILEAFKKINQDKFNENLNYCVGRLVAGLASPRGLARRGFGTLLMDILINFQVSTERLLALAQEKFGTISKVATRDNLLGYFLLISIIMRSGAYKRGKSSAQHIEKMYGYLMQLVNTKSYFEYPVSQLIREYYKTFHPSMVAEIPQHAFGSDTKLSPNQLLNLVLCNKQQAIRELVSLDGATFIEMCSILKNDRLQKRPLHPIFFEVSKFIIDYMPSQFDTFYSTILFPIFFKANHNELASMGLELTAQLVESIDHESASDIIKILMSEHVVRILILSLRNKNKLYEASTEFFKSLKNQFAAVLKENEPDKSWQDEKQYAIMSRLTNSPGSLNFDIDSKSHCLSELLNHCRANVLKQYLNRVTDFITRKPIKDDHGLIVCTCIRQIGFVSCRSQMIEQHSTRENSLKFILTNFLFRPNEQQDTSELRFLNLACNVNTSKLIHKALKDTYHTILHHMVSTCNSSERINLFSDLVDYCYTLFKNSGLVYRNEDLENGSARTSEIWTDYEKSLKSYKKILKKYKDSRQLYPITTLFYFYGLQLFEHQLQCKSQLEELIQSATDSMEGDPKDGSWADILTDQIIAILSATECSPWIRKVCGSVFGSLLPHISPTSIDLICDAIKAPFDCDDGEDDADSEGDNVSQESEMETSEVDDQQQEEEMSVDDDESEADSEESKEDDSDANASPDSFGEESSDEEASSKEDGDESREEYLDDEQMMKLDSVIADMFKMNRVGKKKRRLDPSFKLRCLDLVEKILVKKRNDKETVARISETVIPLSRRYRKLAETRPIAEKIDRMIKAN